MHLLLLLLLPPPVRAAGVVVLEKNEHKHLFLLRPPIPSPPSIALQRCRSTSSGPSEQEILAKYQSLQGELQQTYQKVSELEGEVRVHL